MITKNPNFINICICKYVVMHIIMKNTTFKYMLILSEFIMENHGRILINKGESIINARNLTEKSNNNTNSQNSNAKSHNSTSKPNIFLKNVNQDKVLEIVKQKGPITINQLKRELHADSVIISAYLSEFVNKKLVKVTSVQLGSSVFYYFPEQNAKLEYLTQYLNEKDQGTVHLLKEKKVLRDYDQTLFVRASIRKIKDFAIPIKVNHSDDESEIFWVYYLIKEEEAKQRIREILNPALKNLEEPAQVNLSEQKQDVVKKKESEVESKKITQSSKPESTTSVKEETLTKSAQSKTIKVSDKKDESSRKELLKNITTVKPKENITKPKESQDVLEAEINIDDKLKVDTTFIEVKRALEDKNIVLESASLVRKGKEYDLVIKVKTTIGFSRFFAKFKNKKRCNDSDISTAIVIGQSKHLPVAFITSGELSKKTKQKTNTLFHNVMIVENFGK